MSDRPTPETDAVAEAVGMGHFMVDAVLPLLESPENTDTMITIGKPIAFGIDAPLPLKGFPRGKYRVRLRPNEFAKVYVKTEDGIREFTAEIADDHWTPGPEMARNIRGQNAEVSDVCPPLASETEKSRTGTRSLH